MNKRRPVGTKLQPAVKPATPTQIESESRVKKKAHVQSNRSADRPLTKGFPKGILQEL